MMAMQPATNEYNAGFRGNTHSSGTYTWPVPVTNETELNRISRNSQTKIQMKPEANMESYEAINRDLPKTDSRKTTPSYEIDAVKPCYIYIVFVFYCFSVRINFLRP